MLAFSREVTLSCSTMTTPHIDLSAPEFNRDPYTIFAKLRKEYPVCKVMGQNRQMEWLITRYRDVEVLLNDKEHISKDLRRVIPRMLGRSRRSQMSVNDLVNNNLLFRDPPDHTRLRSLVTRAFTNRNLAGMQGSIDKISEELLENLSTSDSVDLIRDFAYPFPLLVIMELLGIEESDRDYLRACTSAVVEQTSADATFSELSPQLQDFLRYLDARFTARESNTSSGLIDELLRVQEDGVRLSREELFNMVVLLIVAGFETVVNLIGNSTLNLLQNREQLQMFMQNPLVADDAIEELLRFDGPIKTSTKRWAKKDFEFGGQTIRRGEAIRLAIGSANRDEEVFRHADQLDITREGGSRHLAFGGGIHYCIGTMLARMEGKAALAALFQRYPKLRLALPAEDLSYRSSILVRSLRALPVYLN